MKRVLKANITSKAKLAPTGRPRKDHRSVTLISNACRCGFWYGEPDAISNAGGYTKFRSRSHDAIIRVYDSMDNVIDTHKHAGDGVKRRL